MTETDYDRYQQLLARNTAASNQTVLQALQQEQHWILARALAWILEQHIQRIGHWKVPYVVDFGRVQVGFKAFAAKDTSIGLSAIHAALYWQVEERIEVVAEEHLEAPEADCNQVYRFYLFQQLLPLTQQLLPFWEVG